MMEKDIASASIKETIGKIISEKRLSLNLSLEELAEKMKTSPGYVGLVERGRRSFTVLQMITLSKIFDVTLDELVPTSNYENWPQIAKIIACLRQMNKTDIEQVTRLCESLSKPKA